MKCIGRIAAVAIAFGLSAASAFAQEPADQPAKLTDGQLDQVSAGDGALLNLPLDLHLTLENIAIAVNVSNVPINAAVAVQANALGQAIQSATVLAGQTVQQAQYFNP